MNKRYLLAAVTMALLIALLFAWSVQDINFWPTDSEMAYIPAATTVFSSPFISDIHHSTLIKYKIMYGKEALVLGIAIFQRLLGDLESLFPNVLLLIVALGTSGVLIFLILRRWFNDQTALLGFLIFMTSYWTYQYTLQGAHQPLVLMNFLWAVFFVQRSRGSARKLLYAGLFVGLMIFSSPTAFMYMPYILAVYWHAHKNSFDVKPVLSFVLGVIAVLLFFTLPDPGKNIGMFISFLKDSQGGSPVGNHFQYIEHLSQGALSLPKRGAGLEWIVRYMMLAMPVLFSVYAFFNLYFLGKSIKKRQLVYFLMVLACASTLIGVELMQVAQFGRNYFSWLPGMIFLICAGLFDLFYNKGVKEACLKFVRVFLIVTLAGHIFYNGWIFFKDVYPSRMGTKYLADYLLSHPDQERYAYRRHVNNVFTLNVLNNPRRNARFIFQRVDSIKDVKEGFIVIPGTTHKTILQNCYGNDFLDDPELNRLMASGRFHEFVAASFPSLNSSRLWAQEEEYCTYRDLIRKEISDADRVNGRIWVLDAGKLQAEWFGDALSP